MNERIPVLKDLISELKHCLVENWHCSFIFSSNRQFWNVGSWLKNNNNLKDRGDLMVLYTHEECGNGVVCSEKSSSTSREKNKELKCDDEEMHKLVTRSIIGESESWQIQIKECSLKDDKIIIKLKRENLFKVILNSVQTKGLEYGSREKHGEVILMSSDLVPENCDMSQLRLALTTKVLVRILTKLGYTVSTSPTPRDRCLKLHLTLNPAVKASNDSTFVCGVVRNSCGRKKEVNISADNYRRMREKDMEQASIHKYGSSALQPSWKNFIATMADSAVTIDLLCTKPWQPVSLDLQDKFVLSREKSSKGATFLLYNYARLISILKQFDEKVREGVYPPLTLIEAIDFSLLSSEEEWMLLYCYLLPYPSLLSQLVNPKVLKFDIHVLIHFMQDLCKCLSAYYSRVHILTEPRKHLLPLMYARLHLISGIKMLMQNIFILFNIIPVSQM